MARLDGEQDSNARANAGCGETFAQVIARRISRRAVLKAGAGVSTLMLASPVIGYAKASAQATPVSGTPGAGSSLTFQPIAPSTEDRIIVAQGYTATPFLRWGDPITPDAPEFDPEHQTAAAQAKQVGYNHDFTGFLPLPAGSDSSDHGLLWINHESTDPEMMFPGYLIPNPAAATPVPEGEEVPEFVPNPTKEMVDVQLEAHGATIVEIRRTDAGQWELVRDSPYNRRITATTLMELTGPAAGHDLLKTSADPAGTEVVGMLNECSAGITPWGTVLTTEENFHQYFANRGQLAEDDPVRHLLDRVNVPAAASERLWEQFYDRFDVTKEPHESLRFGWLVEVDPYDAAAIPRKRTALGRAKHENTSSVVTPSGQVAVYTGDDERFEYVYKFVTANTFNPNDRAANMDLLDEGTLYVARFNDDGTGDWLPLVHGEGPLTEANGFASQAEVLINARGAGDAVGATMMDRPEDIETSPLTGKVYMVMTNNTRRGTPEGKEGPNAANPRPENKYGHVIEVTEDGNDHAATSFRWEIFILAGPPEDPSTDFGGFPKERVSAISSPDNAAIDKFGNLWLATDGMPDTLELNDGLFAVPVEGSERGYLRQFLSAVSGAEVSGPYFTPDNTTLFVSIMHPGGGGTYEEPLSRWPDGEGPPRPALVVVQAENGGPVGSA